MSDPSQDLQGAAEYLQATISVEHLDSVTTEDHVRKALEALPGVRSVSFVEGKLHVSYDPLQTSEQEMEAAIQKRGEHPVEGCTERVSPFADLSE